MSSQREQIAMELQKLLMLRLFDFAPIQFRGVERFLTLRIDESFIEKAFVLLLTPLAHCFREIAILKIGEVGENAYSRRIPGP